MDVGMPMLQLVFLMPMSSYETYYGPMGLYGILGGQYTVRKKEFKFKSEELIQCVVTIKMVCNLKTCSIGCDDNVNSVQFLPDVT
jgi:hypothetical protein